MNEAIATGFNACGWQDRRQHFYVTSDAQILKQIYSLDADAQRDAIEEAGLRPIRSYNQTDFVKDRVAVEVQFGKYAFVAHDLFVKHMAFFVSDLIDVGIEVLPMKELELHMSSGVPYFERDLLNIIRQGRGVPAVPLVLLGVAPQHRASWSSALSEPQWHGVWAHVPLEHQAIAAVRASVPGRQTPPAGWRSDDPCG